jgi:hypothetical protein
MKPTEKQKAEVRRYVEKHRLSLYLHQWEINIRYTKDSDSDAGADIKMQVEYKEATITIHEHFFTLEKQKREAIIVHELCHIIVQPLIELICKADDGHNITIRETDWHKESVTQHIATIISYP